MSKDICILLGAGFSRAVADMPTLESVSKSVQEALKKSEHISNDFKNLIINDPQNQPWNYEQCCELITYLRQVINSDHRAKYFFDNKIDIRSHAESVHATEEIMYQIVLNKLINSSNKTKYKKIREHFEKFLSKLVSQNFTIHIFDLNHDLVIDSIFNDSNKKIKYENFFRHNEEKAYTLNNIPVGSGNSNLFFLPYRNNLMYSNEAQIYHYKLHGSLNIVYLMGMPFGEKHLPKDYATGPHLVLAYKNNGRPDYGTIETKNALLKVFQQGIYKDTDLNEHSISSSIINVGNLKSQILTKDFLQYFPDCYAQFAKLGSRGATLFSVGYSFRDSHINHIIQKHFDTEIYGPYYENDSAKILFSGKEDISSITEPLNQIRYSDNGIMPNNHSRNVICSDQYFERFTEKIDLNI